MRKGAPEQIGLKWTKRGKVYDPSPKITKLAVFSPQSLLFCCWKLWILQSGFKQACGNVGPPGVHLVTTWGPFRDHLVTSGWPFGDHLVTVWGPMAMFIFQFSFSVTSLSCFHFYFLYILSVCRMHRLMYDKKESRFFQSRRRKKGTQFLCHLKKGLNSDNSKSSANIGISENQYCCFNPICQIC